MPRNALARAVQAVDRAGILLVYPLANRADPPSLWGVLHPRIEMRWAWDDGADPRVAALWHLREQLARSREVVYSKWWQNRATFFARGAFRATLARLRSAGDLEASLSRGSREVLDALRDSSPQGTRALRAAVGLEGRVHEPEFVRALRPLWSRLLIVGAGEAEEGGFPSLAMGATDLLLEDLWTDDPRDEDDGLLERALLSPSFARALRRVEADLRGC